MPEIVTLDVRPILAEGQEPFAAIMEAAETLTSGQTLRLLAPFRPVPLFRVMEQLGYQPHETPLRGGDWQVDFSRPAQALSPGSTIDAVSWPEPSQLLDLTALKAPAAMQRILTAVAAATIDDVIFALLDREPTALLPQLDAHGYLWAGNHAPDGSGYRLMVRRNNGS